METSLKVGQLVTVYQDVMDCRIPEGTAVLVRLVADAERCGWYCGSPIERWDVRFDDEPERTFQRQILVTPDLR